MSAYKFSEPIAELTAALVEFNRECPPVVKSKRNPMFNSRYEDLGGILEVTKPLLAKNNLAVIQLPIGDNSLVTRLQHTSGQFIEFVCDIFPREEVIENNKETGVKLRAITAQAIGSAIQYQRRYSYCAILQITLVDEDDDGNAASKGNAQTKPQTKAAVPGAKPISKPEGQQDPPQVQKLEPLATEKIMEIINKISEASLDQMLPSEAALTRYGLGGAFDKKTWADLNEILLKRWLEVCPTARLGEVGNKLAAYKSKALITVGAYEDLLKQLEARMDEARSKVAEIDQTIASEADGIDPPAVDGVPSDEGKVY